LALSRVVLRLSSFPSRSCQLFAGGGEDRVCAGGRQRSIKGQRGWRARESGPSISSKCSTPAQATGWKKCACRQFATSLPSETACASAVMKWMPA
jgi:hypothetical protein